MAGSHIASPGKSFGSILDRASAAERPRPHARTLSICPANPPAPWQSARGHPFPHGVLITASPALPSQLTDAPRGVVWKLVKRDDKSSKVPFQAKDGRGASTPDPSHWCDYQTAVEAAGPERVPAKYASIAKPRYAGVGFVLGDGFAGVDLDDCRDPETGAVEDWAQAAIDSLAASSCSTCE